MAKNNNTLVFNGLMQGMSWDLIKEAKEEIQRHLGEKQPTRKDILTDWIIGKDYMLQLQGNSYEGGGSFNLNPNNLGLYALQHGNNTGTNFNTGSSSTDTSTKGGNVINTASLIGGLIGMFDQLGGKEYAGLSNKFGNTSNDIYGNVLTGDVSTGMLGGVTNRDKLVNDTIDNILSQEQYYTIGDNASIMALSSLYKPIEKSTSDASIIDFWGNIFQPGVYLLSGDSAVEQQKRINYAVDYANARNIANLNTASTNSNLLNTFTQLQHMTKNGGKLKKAHKFAEGGLLNTYDYGLEEVNAGGSHEDNPNEGVVVSYAPDGLPNKVEEGETIHNDYVYSKRLEANEKVLKNNLLDEKYEGKSFADISKKLTEDRKKRPNDPISVRTNEENLNRLQGALEELKLDNKTREVKRFLGSLNNELLNALQLEMMDEYEAYAEQLTQQLEQEDLVYQEEQAALEGMFGRGGHLKQEGSLLSNLYPVRDAEGKIVGWKQPDASTEKVLNLSGYNPDYEGALIYADDRGWYDRTYDKADTWLKNHIALYGDTGINPLLFMPYVGNVIGGLEGIRNNDLIEVLLSSIIPLGKLGKASKVADKVADTEPILRNISDAVEGKNLTRSLQQDRAIDKMLKNAYEELVSSKAPSKTSTPKTATRKPKKASTQLKQVSQEANNNTSNSVTEETRKAKFLRRLKNFGISTGVSTGIGAAINFGVKENERLKAIKNIYDSEIPILESDSVKVPYSNTNNYIYSPDSSYWYDPVEGRMFYKKSEGGRLFLDGGFAPYEFEEVNGEVFAHRNINRNGKVVTLTIPEAEFTPDIVTAYGIWKQRNSSNNSNVSTKKTPVRPKSTSTPKSTTTSPNNPNYTGLDYMPDSTPISVELPLSYILDINPNLFGEFNSDEIVDSNLDFIDYSLRPKANPLNSALNGKTTPPPRNPELEPNYLSYLRYAPILGSLGLVLSDTLGLTNQPDYSNINMYRRAVDSIGGVNFVPIGGYLQHTPIDREYIANQLLALAATYNRSLNNANPVGSYILGLVNDAKVRDQIGDMYINAATQDEKNKLAVAEYNRGIDITNARNSLAVQSENARLRALRANEYQKIATMRDNERNTAEAARAANYLGLFTNIGNLGTDEMNRTMVNRNPALFYGVNSDGSIYFKNAFWGLSEDTQNKLIDMLEKQGYKISK